METTTAKRIGGYLLWYATRNKNSADSKSQISLYDLKVFFLHLSKVMIFFLIFFSCDITSAQSQQEEDCLDFTNFNSGRVLCRYGYYSNPDAYLGVINYGSSNRYSRHTVHTSTTETDPRTNYQLSCVAPGESHSVRLGNWNNGSQAESITYSYDVDTSQFNLLILKYASVMENPGHEYDAQPRFTFRIMDSTGFDINENCYSADFVSSASLGWNSIYSGSVLWKDWTTVGVDLDLLHGQTIFIKLTTYDCNHDGHYGYAYFSLSCGNKVIASSSCGEVTENDFSAPEGFSYRWYRDSLPEVTLSTSRTITVYDEGVYKCDLNFIEATGDECAFTMTAISGPRYPSADFEYFVVDSNCMKYCYFRNRSVITSDTSHTEVISPRCETYLWDFGDGTISQAVNPIHPYPLGDYHVTLYSMIANGDCVDSISMQLSFQSQAVHQYDTIVENQLPWQFGNDYFNMNIVDSLIFLTDNSGCDSAVYYNLFFYPNIYQQFDTIICDNYLPMQWEEHTFAQAGSFVFSMLGLHGEDSVVTYSIAQLPTTLVVMYDTLVENSLPLLFAGNVFSADVEDSTFLFTNRFGCDSTILLNLKVYLNIHENYDTVVCDDVLPMLWKDRLFTEETVRLDTMTASHGEDSIVQLSVVVNPTFERFDSVFLCDGESYTFINETYFSDVHRIFTLQTVKNCDSIKHLYVHVSPVYNIHDTINTIENNLPITFGGQQFSSAVDNFPLYFTTESGCDSIIHVSINVYYNIYEAYDTIVCDDVIPMLWKDRLFTEETVRLDTMTASHGEDSIVQLSVVVNPTFERFDSVYLCDGENYLFLNHSFEMTMDTFFTLSSAKGCDSVKNLHVHVYPVFSVVDSAAICDGTLYFNADSAFSTSGDHEVFLHSVQGCDSTIHVNLTVNPNFYSFDSVEVCFGYPYSFNGTDYYKPGYYSTLLSTIYGCDSLFSFYLSFVSVPDARIIVEPQIVDFDNHQVQLFDNSNLSYTRYWYIDGESYGSDKSFFYNFPVDEDTVWITLISYNRLMCTDTAYDFIAMNKDIIWAANAFTPEESTNNTWCIKYDNMKEGTCTIYTRAGQFVAEFDAMSQCWNGYSHGQLCKQDAYVWVLHYTTVTEPRNSKKRIGTVLLLQ